MESILIRFKNNVEEIWEPETWDDYSYEGAVFVVKKNGAWIGIYNMTEVRSITIE